MEHYISCDKDTDNHPLITTFNPAVAATSVDFPHKFTCFFEHSAPHTTSSLPSSLLPFTLLSSPPLPLNTAKVGNMETMDTGQKASTRGMDERNNERKNERRTKSSTGITSHHTASHRITPYHMISPRSNPILPFSGFDTSSLGLAGMKLHYSDTSALSTFSVLSLELVSRRFPLPEANRTDVTCNKNNTHDTHSAEQYRDRR